MASPANLALDGGDPRQEGGLGVSDYPPQMIRKLHDPTISFEEYLHYAKESRAWEASAANEESTTLGAPTSALKRHFRLGGKEKEVIQGQVPHEPEISNATVTEKDSMNKESPKNGSVTGVSAPEVTDDEWSTAARAARTATWGAVFFLLTTDILGPFSVPWAIAQTGFGPGWALYTLFGIFAGYSGWQIWVMYIHLDSDRHPCKSYGDIAYRIFGPWARHCVNVLQSIQLLFIVSGVVLSSGQSIAQISKNSICYIICIFIYTIAGMFVGQVRTLQKFGWLANLAVWLNLLIMFIVMGVAAHSSPNYQAALASYSIPEGPIITYAGTPPGTTFVTALNGLNQAIYSYGGSMMFCEFMSEMRKPTDFWKGLICAQAVIYTCYVTFGMVVYSFQGQFAFNPAMQGLSPYNWQTGVNIMFLFSGLIAACLYSNIGIKVMYVNVLQELLHAPPLTTKKGKWLWIGLVPVYWSAAFIICAAIPQFSYISGLVGAVCILQFTYTFPPILMLGFEIKKGAILPSEVFDAVAGRFVREDGGVKRWARGFMKKWGVNAFNVFFALGAATTAVLGIYSSVVSLIAGFEGRTVATSFGCAAPV